MKIAPAGDRAVLIELGAVSAAELHAKAAEIRLQPDVAACIPGRSSLYVVYGRHGGEAPMVAAPAIHEITVSFRDDDGPDRSEFLALHDLELETFLEKVRTLRLIVRYIGFRGGFGYLDGWPREWAMPRRPTSRPHVAAGTFAIAGDVAGFYPIDSPGGWNLLGRTGTNLAHALTPGDEIRILPTLDAIQVVSPQRSSPPDLAFPLELRNSPLTRLVTAADWSRTLRGLPPGGPFDDVAAAHANRAAGNADDAPLFESALTGPVAIAKRDLVCSWFGAEAEVMVNGVKVADARQFEVREGDEIRAGRIRNGLRGYLAAGDRRGTVAANMRNDRLTIRAIAGPHETSLRSLVCEVSSELDRVGIRMRLLQPAAVDASATLPSCGMQCGTIQLHPDGSVVAMGPDHPVTGGYLQPMTVISSERWKLAQLAPGDTVSFRSEESSDSYQSWSP
ncbi:MAG TPA: carboxyltransferase domain-containing protein [Thermoanaerobaculia bacterium]|nr:carboxyltransferase domain-containing protein [Thermoanaerobaculia bacterium]